MGPVFPFRPQFCQCRFFRQNIGTAAPLDQPLIIKCGGALYPIGHFAWRFFHQSETSSLNVQHVFEPCFDPAAKRHISEDLSLLRVGFRNQRCESAAVAAAEHVQAIWSDEVVLLYRTERGAVPCKLRFEISLRTITFAVPA